MSSRRLCLAVLSTTIGLLSLAGPAFGAAHWAKGNGPFRPASDCSAWSPRWQGIAERACAYHFGTVVHHGLQLTSSKARTLNYHWALQKRHYGKAAPVRQFGPYYTGSHRLAAGAVYTAWYDAGSYASTCVRTVGDFSTGTTGATISPWQHGYDNNKPCP